MDNLICDICNSEKNVSEKLFTFSMVHYNICKSCDDRNLVEKEFYQYLNEQVKP